MVHLDRPGAAEVEHVAGQQPAEQQVPAISRRSLVDALDHPHYIAPTGGAILDMSITGKDDDSVRHIFQATGLLPEEAFHYTSLEVIEDGDPDSIRQSERVRHAYMGKAAETVADPLAEEGV